MPEQNDHCWSVTPDTNVDAVAEELATVCSSFVLPWLGQFETLAEMDWKPLRGTVQHRFAEAAANLVVGNREKAAHCIEAELVRIRHDPVYRDQSNEWMEEQISRTKEWAAKHGILVS